MWISVAVISIVLVSLAALAIRKTLAIKICPVCAGTAATWAWMLLAKGLGYAVDPLVLSLLVGGSVVGVMSLLEKRYPAGRTPIIWKMFFVPLGFVTAWGLVNFNWLLVLGGALALIIITAGFFSSGRPESQRAKELEKKMENCC